MLIKALKAGQSLFLGEHLSIKVLECSKGRVRLGISAPEDLCISAGTELQVQEPAGGGPEDDRVAISDGASAAASAAALGSVQPPG
ncbi:MAG: carbon storage regulator [Succinivibrio sp.]|nr:carbon storage regulator [Succinivibrio sp.]